VIIFKTHIIAVCALVDAPVKGKV